MKRYVLLSIFFSVVLMLSGCSSTVKSIELRLSGREIVPVDLSESPLPPENETEETLPTETEPAEPETTVTDPPETEPTVTEPPETEPTVTDPPETAPPATEPPATAVPTTAAPATEPPTTAPTTVAPATVSNTEPDEDLPLQVDGCFHAAREFYEGEYLKHLCLGAWVGDDYIPGSELTFSQERLARPGVVTVTVSWKEHTDERTFEVLPKEQFVLTQADLEWFACSESATGTNGMRLNAAWLYERLMKLYPDIVSYRPLPSDVIPEAEFQFTPSVVTQTGTQQVQVTCRGLSYEFWIGLN